MPSQGAALCSDAERVMQMAVAKRTLAEPWALGTNVFDRDMLFFSGPVPSPPPGGCCRCGLLLQVH